MYENNVSIVNLIKKEDKKRNSAIELLRILAMIMIMFHHFALHGGFEWQINEITLPHLWNNFILMGGKIGVNIFIFISGFFLINDLNLNFKKILKLWGQIFFYSITIYLIFVFTNNENFSIKMLFKVSFPIVFSQWWFATTYFMLFLIHPFLNKLLNSLDQISFQKLILIMVFCWSIIPTITKQYLESNNLIWFITIYSIGSYIRLFKVEERLYLKKIYIFFYHFL